MRIQSPALSALAAILSAAVLTLSGCSTGSTPETASPTSTQEAPSETATLSGDDPPTDDPTPAGASAPGEHEWVRTNPGGGGTIATVGATADGTIIAASDLSGAYRSTDEGVSFTPLGSNQGLTATHTTSLGFHPTDGQTFFVGAGWGAYKTTDGGGHFVNVQDSGYIEGFSFPAANPLVGYMAHHDDWDTPGNVLRTTDGGDTWQPVDGENLPDIRIVKVLAHPLDPDIVYALGGKTRWGCSVADLYRSTDGGTRWNRVGADYQSILDVDIDPADPDTVFITTFETNPCAPEQVLEAYLVDDYEAGGLFRSTNGGDSWDQLSDQTGIISVADADTIRVTTVLFPYDWNENAGTWQTEDGGASWELIGRVTDWEDGWVTNQYFAYSASFNGFNKTVTKDLFRPDRLYASFGSWAWASFNGGATLNNISTVEVSPDRWQSTGMENTVGHGLAISGADPNVIYMGGYDIGMWTSLDRGQSWGRTMPSHTDYEDYVWSEGQGSNVTALVADPDRAGVVWTVFHREGFGNGGEFEAGTNSALFKSTDFGQTWTKNTSLPDARFFYGLTLDPDSPADSRTMFMTVEGNVVRSTDDGETWAIVLANGGLKFTTVDAFDSGLIYAGGEDGLWRSADGGDSWEEVGLDEMKGPLVGNFLPTEGGWEGVFDITTDPTTPDRVFVVAYGVGKGLYRSDDRGVTWDKLYENDYMRGIAVSAETAGLVYATSSDSYHSGGTDFEGSDGIVYSTDAGDTWNSASDSAAWPYGGRIRIAGGPDPYVIAWAPGTGLQMADLTTD